MGYVPIMRRGMLVIYCVFPGRGIIFGVERLRVLEYDTEQQVAGNHLLYAWETLVGDMSSAGNGSRSRVCLSAGGNHLLGAKGPGYLNATLQHRLLQYAQHT